MTDDHEITWTETGTYTESEIRAVARSGRGNQWTRACQAWVAEHPETLDVTVTLTLEEAERRAAQVHAPTLALEAHRRAGVKLDVACVEALRAREAK